MSSWLTRTMEEIIKQFPSEQEVSVRPGYVDIVFDGPPGPDGGRFIEVENASGKSIRFGVWVKRDNNLWALRIRKEDWPT